MSTSKTIVLKSSDGETFEVEAAVAMESQTIKHLIDANCIPLPNVTSKILFKVIEYCKRHLDAPKSDDKSSEDDLKKFDEEFVKVDDNTLFDLILAANYLNIGSLLDLTRQTVADMIKGKNPDEIKKIFSVKNDFKVLMATSSDRQENVGDNRQPESSVEIKDKFRRYIPLVKATLEGDWDFAGGFFGQEGGALTASLTKFSETALHIVVGTGKAIHFLEELVRSMPVQALQARDRRGDTALHTAARVGNTAAAVILAEKHQPLLYMPTKCCMLPVHVAALTGSKDTLSYLLEVTMDDPNAKPYHDESGIGLLTSVITSGFYDIALKLIDRYPHLATLKNSSGDCALGNIAMKVSAFPSGSRLNLWERIIYSYVPVKLENNSENQNGGDIENQRRSAPFWGANFSIFGHAVSQKLQAFFWKVLELSVPQIKHVQEQKHMHLQALQLVKCLCEKIQSLDDSIDYESLAKDALFTAVKFGVHEVVEEIVVSFPSLVWEKDSEDCRLFHRAVIERHENVFNLIYQMKEHKRVATFFINKSTHDTILHLAGRLAPPNKLNLIPGAALQMQ